MARPTARVLALLEILQAGGTPHRRRARRAARCRRAHGPPLRRAPRRPRRPGVGRARSLRRFPARARLPDAPLMLTDDEALAVLLGLVVARRIRAGPVGGHGHRERGRQGAPGAAARLGARLDALLETVGFTAPQPPRVAAETDILLLFAEAARDRRAVAVTYRSADGRRASARGAVRGGRPRRPLVRHRRRLRAAVRSARSGWTASARLRPLPATFTVPDGRDPRSGCSPLWPRRRAIGRRGARPGRRARRRPARAAWTGRGGAACSGRRADPR